MKYLGPVNSSVGCHLLSSLSLHYYCCSSESRWPTFYQRENIVSYFPRIKMYFYNIVFNIYVFYNNIYVFYNNIYRYCIFLKMLPDIAAALFKETVWDYLRFLTWYTILLDVTIRWKIHWDGHDQQQYSGKLLHLNNTQLVQRSLKCVKKNILLPLQYDHQHGLFIQIRMDLGFSVVYVKFWPNIWTSQLKLIRQDNALPVYYPVFMRPNRGQS